MAKKISLLFLIVILIYSITACAFLDKFRGGKGSADEPDTTLDEESTPDEITGTIEPVATSLESPGNAGDWIEIWRYSAVDGTYHQAYYRIKSVIRDSDEVEEVLEDYNGKEHATYFKEIDNEDIEYCLIKYEVYFPEDFPTEEAGICSVSVDFTITTRSGDDIQIEDKKYTELNDVYDITESPETNTLYGGQTFTEGLAVFSMVKDYSDYIIKSYYLNNNELIYSYVQGK